MFNSNIYDEEVEYSPSDVIIEDWHVLKKTHWSRVDPGSPRLITLLPDSPVKVTSTVSLLSDQMVYIRYHLPIYLPSHYLDGISHFLDGLSPSRRSYM